MSRPQPLVPGPGQESVWDYPRPPRLERTTARLRVVLGGRVVAETTEGYRVLETSHPPTYYLPPHGFLPGSVRPVPGSTVCEWKGEAAYGDLVSGDAVARRAVWWYPQPTAPFLPIAGYLAVMPALVDACFVDEERVVPQPGGFYGGWVTSKVVGPFKGGPGTHGW
ncbi:DUF427 domain-containing protein [Knoellia sp. 3-2P3]|uniref:DUF427 domain-containing protein n=1 Tax=unclassified Knoellia TaxID=2618719 RepID=UPI0023DC6545|nr:DUF427 domain-containing protein [Knoellia sp. 3-2P3]MDF2092793.1 DUF427 domain-containing protein [Knoellia sp. 3-2P3]